MTVLAFMDVGFGEMVVVAFVALLLFGGRLPEVMRTLGASYRNLRKGVDDLSRHAMRPDLPPRPAPRYQPSPPPPPSMPAGPIAPLPAPRRPAEVGPDAGPAPTTTAASAPPAPAPLAAGPLPLPRDADDAPLV